jgi:hypothetical protein
LFKNRVLDYHSNRLFSTAGTVVQGKRSYFGVFSPRFGLSCLNPGSFRSQQDCHRPVLLESFQRQSAEGLQQGHPF